MYKYKEIKIDKSGFTLIELLIVIAILGVLLSIATPLFLGQRGKAKVRCVEGSAKSAVSEIQSWVDAFIEGSSFIALNANGKETCFECTSSGSKSCSTLFPDVSSKSTYNCSDIGSIIDIAITHHQGKKELNCFDSTQSLFVRDTQTVGSVVLSNAGSRTIRIQGYADSTVTPIFETIVPSR